jgi:hypothetical protein
MTESDLDARPWLARAAASRADAQELSRQLLLAGLGACTPNSSFRTRWSSQEYDLPRRAAASGAE